LPPSAWPGNGPARRNERGRPPRLHGPADLTRLRFFWNSPQGTQPDATGHKGFYYLPFLDMETGQRVWDCELSTVDSAFLLAGMLTAATFFDQDTAEEHEIRTLADALYPPGRLALGAERRGDPHARLEAGVRLHPLPLGRL